MPKTLIAFICRKYLKYDKNLPFIFVTACLALVGIAIGVMVLVVTMAIMQGMTKEFENKLMVMNYPLTLHQKYFNKKINQDLLLKLQNQFPKLAFSPFIKTQALLKDQDQFKGVLVFGVNAALEKKTNPVFKQYFKKAQFAKFEAFIGKQLQQELEQNKAQNLAKISLYFTQSTMAGLLNMPRVKRFRLDKSFESGLINYDKTYIYTDIQDLRLILKIAKDEFDGIHIFSKHPKQDQQKLNQFLDNQFFVIGWWEQNKAFFQAIALEKKVFFIVLLLIIIIATLNIISALLMTVMMRRKEIAFLLSLGVSRQQIKQIFFRIGAMIGISGTSLGLIFGILSVYVLNKFQLIKLDAAVYGIATLPLEISLLDLGFITIVSIIIVLLAAFYPAKKASEINALRVLRNE